MCTLLLIYVFHRYFLFCFLTANKTYALFKYILILNIDLKYLKNNSSDLFNDLFIIFL